MEQQITSDQWPDFNQMIHFGQICKNKFAFNSNDEVRKDLLVDNWYGFNAFYTLKHEGKHPEKVPDTFEAIMDMLLANREDHDDVIQIDK